MTIPAIKTFYTDDAPHTMRDSDSFLTQVYGVYRSTHNAPVGLQKMMDTISQLQSESVQKEDLDELFATIFPKVYN